jgi:hypothetical protein
VGDDVPIDNEMFLVIDFINLKIKPAQSFRITLQDIIYVYVFIESSIYMYMSIYVIF